MVNNKKRCLIIVAIIVAVVLIGLVCYFFVGGDKFGCKEKMEWVCPEWVEECYKESEVDYKNGMIGTECPGKDFVCEYKEVEVCE